jgi:hypothetical protein
MPTHFEIEVTLEPDSEGSSRRYTVLRNIPGFLHPGDTARYRSNDGDVTVNFDPNHSPFVDSHGKEILVVTSKDRRVKVGSKKGKYFAKCSIKTTTPQGEIREVRYPKDAPPSGGNHVVKGPGQ